MQTTANFATIYEQFTDADQQEIKDTEKITNHDVKAVEYFIKKRFDELGLQDFKEFIHFGLTSQDINNTAIPYTFKLALNEVYYPAIADTDHKVKELAQNGKTFRCWHIRMDSQPPLLNLGKNLWYLQNAWKYSLTI